MLKWDFDKAFEYADKMCPILQGLCDGEIWYVLVYLAHRLLIPGWFDREDVARIVQCEVSQEEFDALRDFAWDYGDDAAANLIQEYWEAWRTSGQYTEWLRGTQEADEDEPDGSNG